jgi:hypothetical protein
VSPAPVMEGMAGCQMSSWEWLGQGQGGRQASGGSGCSFSHVSSAPAAVKSLLCVVASVMYDEHQPASSAMSL